MSGIIGIVNLDGSAVDRQLVLKLTDFLIFRGPDGHGIWTKSNVGLGHTVFKTTEESENNSQPLTLDGKTWIVADARIDARDELVAQLKSDGQPEIALSDWTDAELILRAYEAWGENCVEHLLGDFAFGIWDETRQQLFCARDHMGVKPFYYAQIGSCVIFSNTLECVREYPGVSDNLNDLAIADFLVFSVNQDSATTSFHDIRRIPPAHSLSLSGGRISLRRYWSMPIDDPIFYKRADDYTYKFRELLNKCLNDRLRSNKVSIFMSGGLDSTTLAAATNELLADKYSDFDLRAITKIDSFAPQEQWYAAAVADHLGIPILYDRWMQNADPGWERIPFRSPEPYPYAWTIPAEEKFWKRTPLHTRTLLYGEGPDNALHCEWAPYLSGLLSRRRYTEFLVAVFKTLALERRPPFLRRLLNTFASWTGGMGHAGLSNPSLPEWLNSTFESRLDLRERLYSDRSVSHVIHPWRPTGYASLHDPLWQTTFESFDFIDSRVCHERRYPFVDIRMLRFMLAIPALPWCRSKRLIRAGMSGRLPDRVLRRHKVTADCRNLFGYFDNLCRLPLLVDESLGQYVNVKRFLSEDLSTQDKLRVRSLNHWLQHSRLPKHNPTRERLVGQTA